MVVEVGGHIGVRGYQLLCSSIAVRVQQPPAYLSPLCGDWVGADSLLNPLPT